MALFGGKRDIMLFKTINQELLNDIIQTEVGYYKIDVKETKTNSYGESPGSEKYSKIYHQPVLIPCLIAKGNQTTNADDFGIDKNQSIEFRFLKDTLVDAIIYPEYGDIILYLNNYFEVDDIIENQFIGGKRPDYTYNTDTDGFGSSFSIILKTHMTRRDKLNIENNRTS